MTTFGLLKALWGIIARFALSQPSAVKVVVKEQTFTVATKKADLLTFNMKNVQLFIEFLVERLIKELKGMCDEAEFNFESSMQLLQSYEQELLDFVSPAGSQQTASFLDHTNSNETGETSGSSAQLKLAEFSTSVWKRFCQANHPLKLFDTAGQPNSDQMKKYLQQGQKVQSLLCTLFMVTVGPGPRPISVISVQFHAANNLEIVHYTPAHGEATFSNVREKREAITGRKGGSVYVIPRLINLYLMLYVGIIRKIEVKILLTLKSHAVNGIPYNLKKEILNAYRTFIWARFSGDGQWTSEMVADAFKRFSRESGQFSGPLLPAVWRQATAAWGQQYLSDHMIQSTAWTSKRVDQAGNLNFLPLNNNSAVDQLMNHSSKTAGLHYAQSNIGYVSQEFKQRVSATFVWQFCIGYRSIDLDDPQWSDSIRSLVRSCNPKSIQNVLNFTALDRRVSAAESLDIMRAWETAKGLVAAHYNPDCFIMRENRTLPFISRAEGGKCVSDSIVCCLPCLSLHSSGIHWGSCGENCSQCTG